MLGARLAGGGRLMSLQRWDAGVPLPGGPWVQGCMPAPNCRADLERAESGQTDHGPLVWLLRGKRALCARLRMTYFLIRGELFPVGPTHAAAAVSSDSGSLASLASGSRTPRLSPNSVAAGRRRLKQRYAGFARRRRRIRRMLAASSGSRLAGRRCLPPQVADRRRAQDPACTGLARPRASSASSQRARARCQPRRDCRGAGRCRSGRRR
jgi:hypothetical protein